MNKALTRDIILKTIKNSNSNRHAAQIAGINIRTWKKYASMYTDENGISLYQKHNNKYGIGVTFKKIDGKQVGRCKKRNIHDVLTGDIPATMFNAKDLKAMVFSEGILERKCSCCGFADERLSDGKVPLLISFRNNKRKDWSIDNLELLCYNCYFMQIGNILTLKQINNVEGFIGPTKATSDRFMELSDNDFERITKIWENEAKDTDMSGEDLIVRK